MSNGTTTRRARKGEAELLTALAVQSKATWGYSEEFLQTCREELTLHEDELDEVYVRTAGERIVAFYSLERLSCDRVELGFLFVDPEHLRLGHGSELLRDACERARGMGYRMLVIQGDPHAVPFYSSAGAVLVGTRQSESVAGRMLPLFEMALV